MAGDAQRQRVARKSYIMPGPARDYHFGLLGNSSNKEPKRRDFPYCNRRFLCLFNRGCGKRL
jgi:hypothetical protein